MAEEKQPRRSSLGNFLCKLFRQRSASLGKEEKINKTESIRKKSKLSKSSSCDDTFGIEATDRLTHFQKPKPPQNRRRPRGLPSQKSEVEAILEEVNKQNWCYED